MTDDVLDEKPKEDMFPLAIEFRVATNRVLLVLNQVCGEAVALEETPYRSLKEVRERIGLTHRHPWIQNLRE
jgi:uncharacterized protein